MVHVPRIYLAAAAADTSHPLPDAQAHHLLRVLRRRPGAAVLVFDGAGREFSGRLAGSGRDARVDIGALRRTEPAPALAITLLPAISRQIRMEWMLEKSVELGAAEIRPLLSEHARVRLAGERARRKLAHWQAVVVGAAAQCGRARLPVLAAPAPFAEGLAVVRTAARLMLEPAAARQLAELPPPGTGLALLAGPESGLSDAERAHARAAGWIPVRLGPRVLRAETAVPAALAAVQALWGDWR